MASLFMPVGCLPPGRWVITKAGVAKMSRCNNFESKTDWLSPIDMPVISSGWNRWSARRCGLPHAAVELPAVAAGLLAEHMGFADLMGMAPIAFA